MIVYKNLLYTFSLYFNFVGNLSFAVFSLKRIRSSELHLFAIVIKQCCIFKNKLIARPNMTERVRAEKLLAVHATWQRKHYLGKANKWSCRYLQFSCEDFNSSLRLSFPDLTYVSSTVLVMSLSWLWLHSATPVDSSVSIEILWQGPRIEVVW